MVDKSSSTARLRAHQLELGYAERCVVRGVEVEIRGGSFTAIVGANGCGKSTLLRGLARLLTPRRGAVLLDGASISHLKTRAVAQQIGLLPQSPISPEGITVRELVARGRYPHQGLLSRASAEDEAVVNRAMEVTDTATLADRLVDELSGGQRQRVWVATAIAQDTPIMLLDEPTTFLDLANQTELMNLFRDLNQQGRTMVAVLHELNQAARYATDVIAMKDGEVAITGTPEQVFTAANLAEIFGLNCLVIEDPVTGGPLIVPSA